METPGQCVTPVQVNSKETDVNDVVLVSLVLTLIRFHTSF